MSRLPLDGITVVACEQAVAAPFATRQLADLGARVIKIERPGTGDFARWYDASVGEGLSSHFVWLNRSKESLALDLKAPESLDVMHRLIDRADVFIQNLGPGAADRLGLDAASLRARNEKLITCSISGYGGSGPYRDAKAYDLLIQAEAGLVSVTGTEEFPAKTGISTADIAGGMYAFSGILAALYDRANTGVGTHLDVSLFDSLLEWMGYPLYYAKYGGLAPARTGVSHATIAPYGPFSSGDGDEFVLAVHNHREWLRFCAIVLDGETDSADPRFATGKARVAHRGELNVVIDAVLRKLTGLQLKDRLERADIPWARRRELDSVIAHPQLAARDRWRTVASPAGPISALLPPVVFPGTEPRLSPVPEVGEHTESILAEFGITATDEMAGRSPAQDFDNHVGNS